LLLADIARLVCSVVDKTWQEMQEPGWLDPPPPRKRARQASAQQQPAQAQAQPQESQQQPQQSQQQPVPDLMLSLPLPFVPWAVLASGGAQLVSQHLQRQVVVPLLQCVPVAHALASPTPNLLGWQYQAGQVWANSTELQTQAHWQHAVEEVAAAAHGAGEASGASPQGGSATAISASTMLAMLLDPNFGKSPGLGLAPNAPPGST
jgi:hypothetical protein